MVVNKNQVIVKKDTATIIERAAALKDVLATIASKGEKCTIPQICKKMKDKGWKPYSIPTYYSDKQIVNKSSTFVRDLVETQFSALVEDVYVKAAWVEAEAIQMYMQKWNQNKTIVTTSKNDEGMPITTEQNHETAEIAGPKIQALNLVLAVQKLKHEIISGSNLNLSAALVGEKFQTMEAELIKVRKQLKRSKKIATNT